MPVSVGDHPLKAIAQILFSLVPHSAEVERLFSNLGGIQSAKRCNLSIDNFEMLGKLRSHYSGMVQSRAEALGLPNRRHHAHSRIRTEPGIDIDTVTQLEEITSADTQEAERCRSERQEMDEMRAQAEETITLDDIDKAFNELEEASAHDPPLNASISGRDIHVSLVYKVDELEKVYSGACGTPAEEDLASLRQNPAKTGTWSVAGLLGGAGMIWLYCKLHRIYSTRFCLQFYLPYLPANR